MPAVIASLRDTFTGSETNGSFFGVMKDTRGLQRCGIFRSQLENYVLISAPKES